VPKYVDHDERRRQYLDALWKVVRTQGAQAVSVRSVAAASEHSKSSIAYYFPSRAALLAAAVEAILDDGNRRLARINLDALNATSVVDAIMTAIPHTPAQRRRSQVWLLLLAEAGTDPDLAELLATVQGRVRTAVTDGLAAMVASGLIAGDHDLELEAARLHTLIDGLSLQTLTDPRGMPTPTIRKVVAAWLASVAPDRP
jgi:AcrR family transcriptional regulator